MRDRLNHSIGSVDRDQVRWLARIATALLAGGSVGWLVAMVHLDRIGVLPHLYAASYVDPGIAGVILAVLLALCDVLWTVRYGRHDDRVGGGADA